MTDQSIPDIEPLVYWIQVREGIRRKREAGLPPPWTSDPILRDNKFCNVRREADRVTLWVRNNIRRPFSQHEDLWFMLCMTRVINWPPTLKLLMKTRGAWPDKPGFSVDSTAEAMKAIAYGGADGDRKVFTGAYLVGGGNHTGMGKIDYVCKKVFAGLWEDRVFLRKLFKNHPSLETAHNALAQYHGMGPFLSYQVVVDLRFTPVLRHAPDIESYAAAGPGTRRGLNRVFGRGHKKSLGQKQALEEIRVIYRMLREAVPEIPFDLSDVPNILCETDKMLRVRSGDGKMRARFTPNKNVFR